MQPLRVFLGFLAGFSLAILYCHHAYSRDPTSYFFNPDSSYTPVYSHQREEQALSFITQNSLPTTLPAAVVPPKLCIGILTVHRHGKQHFPAAVGSLLQGLTPPERAQIHLIAFFADPTPSQHESYNAPWVPALIDQVLVRSNDSDLHEGGDYPHLLQNYRHLLQTCYNTNTSYVAIIEDDVIASSTWFQRTMQAVDHLDESWLYVRLFYSETFLGWNSEEWGDYSVWIAKAMAVVLAVLLVVRKVMSLRRSGGAGVGVMSVWTIAVVMSVCMPLMLVLYFLAGRLSMQPLSHGLVRMDNYGCCSQGLVYPHDKVPLVVHDLGMTGLLPDQRVEVLADRTGLARWALVPSVLQHVGRVGSSGKPRKTWNFQFEVEGGQ